MRSIRLVSDSLKLVATASTCVALATIGQAQLSAPSGTVYTSHGLYTYANYFGGPANPQFNIPGNGWMTAPGANYPQVTGHVELSGAQVAAGSPWLTWSTAPAGNFGGATTSLRAFSNGNSTWIRWSNYTVFDRSPIGGGSYNLSGGDVFGTVGPLGWTGRAVLAFPFRVVARKPIGYAALGAAFEVEVYNQLNVVQRVFDLGVIMATDGAATNRPDGLGYFHINWNNSPGVAATLGNFNQWWDAFGTYHAAGWVAIVSNPFAMGAGWKWVINGRLTLLADPSYEMYIDYDQIDAMNQALADYGEDLMGYNVVPEPASLLALAVGLAGVAARRRRKA